MATPQSDEVMADFKDFLDHIVDDTAADVDELSNELVGVNVSSEFNIGSLANQFQEGSLANQFQEMKEELELSYDKHRLGMEDNFESEKNDIVKGFMLEKRILNKEHEKEKKDLVSNFVKEREHLLNSFQDQVQQIEQKMKEQRTNENVISVGNEPRQFSEATNSLPNKLLIRVDGNRINPEEFLSSIELEEKFESEKDNIEKNFRKEKVRIKDKFELQYEKKLLRERHKHQCEIKELQTDIQNLKNLKHEVAAMWKQQASKIELEFHKERTALENHYRIEKESLRRKLEEKSAYKLNTQQQKYDRCINELKSELQNIKSDINSARTDNCKNDQSLHVIRHEIKKQLYDTFERETKIIRQQNEKLNSELKVLTTEKYEMARKYRDLETNKECASKMLKEYSSKLNKEYENKMRKLITQNEKLKIKQIKIENENEELCKKLKTFENERRNVEERLAVTEQTILQCDDTISSMRNENTNLSHEINLLRTEKEDLLHALEQRNEKERLLKLEVSKYEMDVQETSGRYVLLEREKLQHERLIAGLRKELETNINTCNESGNKTLMYEKETERLRQLLDGERRENKRLHERFKQDADLLRKKDADNATIRAQLDNIKTEFENLQTKINADNEKILRSESEKELLQNRLEKMKNCENLQKKHDVIAIQNKYVKEFAKRLDYVKANYEREITNLKNQIEDLKIAGQSRQIENNTWNNKQCCSGNCRWKLQDNYSEASKSSDNRSDKDMLHKYGSVNGCEKLAVNNSQMMSPRDLPTRDREPYGPTRDRKPYGREPDTMFESNPLLKYMSSNLSEEGVYFPENEETNKGVKYCLAPPKSQYKPMSQKTVTMTILLITL